MTMLRPEAAKLRALALTLTFSTGEAAAVLVPEAAVFWLSCSIICMVIMATPDPTPAPARAQRPKREREVYMAKFADILCFFACGEFFVVGRRGCGLPLARGQLVSRVHEGRHPPRRRYRLPRRVPHVAHGRQVCSRRGERGRAPPGEPRQRGRRRRDAAPALHVLRPHQHEQPPRCLFLRGARDDARGG